jgi:hypothetical protein
MRVLALAALAALVALPAVAQERSVQDPPTASDGEPVTRVEDIVVEGRPLAEVARSFVEAVGEAPRGRGLARWHTPMCVGVVNLRPTAAQPLIDHVSALAETLGVVTGEPGCTPNVVFIFSDDPQGLASSMVDANPREFRLGSRTFNLDASALRHFRESDVPVRWWHTSVPTNSDTGERAVRLPGDVDNQGNPSAPTNVVFSSVLSGVIRDDLSRVVVIVDASRASDVSPLQLADYLAFVALAQIDPRGDRSSAPSVLNVFDNPYSAEGLSDWDLAYLKALYRPGGSLRRNAASVADGVARDVARSLRVPETPED